MPAVLDHLGRPYRAQQMRARVAQRRLARTQAVRGAYDAAQTTHENTRHWGWTDSLSADSANSPSIRKRLRERSRYEVANNGWARSMVETLAHEVIGTGPRIQLLTGNPKADEWIERAFAAWCQRVRLARKFRTMRKAKAQDGEGVGLFVNTERLGDVQLNLRLIETEQMSTPDLGYTENQIDGIDLDENGEPSLYHVLRYHPGEARYGFNPMEEMPPCDPKDILHIFRQDRPGQHRGVPELTPALPLFSKLRRYTLAVLQTAENIADITIGLKTEHPDSGLYGEGPHGDTANEPSSYEAFDTFDMERGMVTVLPEGTEPWQPDPKQPATTHTEYLKSVLAEAFAAVCMPYSVGAADSSDENFASGKLTRLGFKRAIQIERRLDWDPEVERTFWTWWAEAKALMPDNLKRGMAQMELWVVTVFWDGTEDIDPEKAARARSEMLRTGQTSYPTMYGEMGQDYETEQSRQAAALGLTLKEYRKRLVDTLLPVKELVPNAQTA